ncbi:DNA polymerase III subunit epsilon [Caldimonas sp. KR1-144]|uniref:DNA polymerase III subunit epsilon n=1 Tax=Caldimonas sp. KR1-144 TaxID=3400911 RepID=UPI003BFD9CA2
MSRQVFLDTETTGLSPENGDRIIEIGCVELVNRRYSERHFHVYLNPERKNHEDAVKVHGLTDEFLADKPKFAAIADELLAWLEGAEIIIHNAAFDVAFLDAELERIGRKPFREHVAGVADSLVMAREMFPGKSNSLDALCKRLEVDNSNRTLHGALLDAGLLAEVYLRMTRGQDSLVIDAGGDAGGASGVIEVVRVDFSAFALPVIEPVAEEAAAHEALLAELDKASGGKTIWRSLVA